MNSAPIDIVVKASALLAAAALADALLGRRMSAAARHLLWSIVIVGLLVLPIASYALPHWEITIRVPRTSRPSVVHNSTRGAPPRAGVLAAPSLSAAAAAVRPQARAREHFDLSQSALATVLGAIEFLYLTGVALLLARLGREPFVLRRLTRGACTIADAAWLRLLEDAATSVGVTRPVRLLRSAGELMPTTFGTRRPAIMVPASADGWTEDRRRAVLLHELAHVARRDCLVQRLTAVACACYWPHPGVWWVARRLRTERELACDDRVLAAGTSARDYAQHLLDLARSLGTSPTPATALAMARARHLETRLLAVLDAARNRAAIRRGVLPAAIAALLAALMPISALRSAVVRVDGAAAPDTLTKSAALDPQSSAGTSTREDFTGTWELRLSPDGVSAHVTIRTAHGSHGTTVSLARLKELGAPDIPTAGPVHFTSRRDAGSCTFDGVCRSGVCGGTFAFEPSAAFAAELTKRGIGTPGPSELYKLALADIGIAWLDELSADGYQKPDLRDIVRAADHGVGLDYVRGMARLGYRVGTVDALIVLRDHGVDAEFVRGMAANGFPRLSPDDLVRARDHGVDPAYVKGMRDLGYRLEDLALLIAARDHGVDPAYVRGMQAFGYRLTLDELQRTRDHGVDPEYVRGLAEFSYKNLAVDALVRARDHGVDPEYVRDLAALGYKGVALDALIRMRDHGVDPEFVRRLQRRGLGQLSVDELIQRRDRGENDFDAAARAMAASIQSVWRSILRLQTCCGITARRSKSS
jgi:beta-lactamase regulating signal transducer with metallopeptidase domain